MNCVFECVALPLKVRGKANGQVVEVKKKRKENNDEEEKKGKEGERGGGGGAEEEEKKGKRRRRHGEKVINHFVLIKSLGLEMLLLDRRGIPRKEWTAVLM